MTFLVFLFVLAGWIYLYNRLRNAEERLEQDSQARTRDLELIAQLTSRVWKLEKSQESAVVKSEPVAEEVVSPVRELLEPPRVIAEPVLFEPPPALEPLFDIPPIPEVFAAVQPRPTWRDQIRESMGGQSWEAIVGGNWLNKLGVLVLVIGIALLLGYEFTRVGPAGRVATGVAASLAMLVTGVVVERKSAYAIFARGLIGGGWAALYFTTYAMHALPAAKIIDNPYVASALLLAVAYGMILHSLRYRSQTVSGLACFIAFATLALSESTPFSVLALLPLAALLLYLAHRFEWHEMAVFGLFATYATCASRPDVNAPLVSTQALFATYWLLFETFDLLRLRRRTQGWSIASFILPGNALGFLGLSAVKWQRSAPEHLYAFLAAAAALYLASALLRTKLRAPSSFDEDSNTFDRIGGGGFEGPITLSATLAAFAISIRAPGEWVNFGLLAEGEVLFLAGFFFSQRYLRRLAGVAFVASMLKIVLADDMAVTTITVGGHTWMNWSPVALLTAAVFYVNRTLRVVEGALYSSAAAALLTLILGFETPREYLCVAWLGLAVVLFELGVYLRRTEFRLQAYIIGALGTCTGLLVNVLGIPAFGAATDWPLSWLPLAICAAIHYCATLRIVMSSDDRLSPEEKQASWITAASSVVFLFAIAWKFAPAHYLGAVWLVIGAALFELGLRGLPKHFQRLSYVVTAAGLWDLFWNHVVNAQLGADPSETISLGVAAAVCWSVSARLFRTMPARIGDGERGWCRDLYASVGALFVMTLLWLRLPPPAVSPLWTVLGLVVFEIGMRLAFPRFRLLAHVIAATVCFRLFVFDLWGFSDALHITHRTFTILPILASFSYVWSRHRVDSVPAWERSASRLYLYAAATFALLLARFELGSTSSLVAWALFGLAAYKVGQLQNILDLRLQSYAIAVLSFFGTTVMLAANREHIGIGSAVIASLYCAQLMAPRDGAPGLERFARVFYSLLASLLLAILLFHEVSGSMLTTAWAVEALALLGAGFPLRDRMQRLSGLALFMICVLKLFLYDLRELETVSRILSFIVLGLILVGVSWMYTRFRDRIQRYL
jgi:hypothetical protein